jgi:zinc transporter ZupT
MAFWEYALLFGSVLAGGALGWARGIRGGQGLRLALSFSGAYILGITVLHLLPILFAGGNARMGLWILLGFLVQLLLDQLSRGVEHGHMHALKEGRSLSWAAVPIMLGLCVHAFIEGMPLSGYEMHSHHRHGAEWNHLLMGVILHKAPAAFALSLLFHHAGMPNRWVWLNLALFAAMSPLGAWLGEAFAFSAPVVRALLGIVTGSFFHIATTILFELEGNNQHQVNLARLAAILLGLAIAVFTVL